MTTYTTDIQPNGILAFRGPDSIKFLQGQTTCHLDELSPSNALYGAFCNPKGRIKSTFLLILESEDSLLMLLSKDQCDYLQEQLKMYIAFFKSEITDVTTEFQIVGWIDTENEASDTTGFVVTRDNNQIGIRLPGSPGRSIVLTPTANSMTDDTDIDSTRAWHLADIKNGLVWTNESGREQFLPHDINLPGMGGVSYDKGCYTGQEIVARMHYRGNPKYTTAVLSCSDTDVVFESPLKAVIADGKTKSIGHPVSEMVSDGEKTFFLASIVKDFLEQDEINLAISSERTILCNISKPLLG